MKVRVEVSALSTTRPSGIGRYAKNLYSALKKIDSEISPIIPFSRIKKSGIVASHLETAPSFYLDSLPLFFKKPALIHALDLRMPHYQSIPLVLTLHDLFIFKNSDDRFSPRAFREKKRLELDRALKQVQEVIVVSQTTKEDLLSYFDFDPCRIHVCHLGLEKSFFIPKTMERDVLVKYKLPSEYLLFIGAISERKNSMGIVKAYAQSEMRKHLPLVMAGEFTYNSAPLLDYIKKEGLENSVIFTNYLDDQDIIPLYDFAKGLIFPTFYEGFGIPLIEAAARKVPVLAGNVGSAREVLQDGALYVDPYNIDEIAFGIDSLCSNSADRVNSAYDLASHYSWDRCAHLTYDVYKRVAGLK